MSQHLYIDQWIWWQGQSYVHACQAVSLFVLLNITIQDFFKALTLSFKVQDSLFVKYILYTCDVM